MGTAHIYFVLLYMLIDHKDLVQTLLMPSVPVKGHFDKQCRPKGQLILYLTKKFLENMIKKYNKKPAAQKSENGPVGKVT